MGSIERYILKSTFGAFAMVLVNLTAIIWVTQALRSIDLVTTQGQTILSFIGITSMLIPWLVLILAPMATVIAIVYVLNKLSSDSEVIVMNAAGLSPWQLFRPFLAATAMIAALQLVIAAYISPGGQREMRRWSIAARADLVNNIVQPGRFMQIERGLVFHFRERAPNGQMLGLMIDDRRNPAERVTILADHGGLVKNDEGTFLVLRDGYVFRQRNGQSEPATVTFVSYAFDLSRFTNAKTVVRFGVRERYFWQLFSLTPNDSLVAPSEAELDVELHNRIVSILLPFVLVSVAFAFLGAPRTARQSRVISLVGVALAVFLLELVVFAGLAAGRREPLAILAQYLVLAGASGLSVVAILRGVIIEPPAVVMKAINTVTERLARRLVPA